MSLDPCQELHKRAWDLVGTYLASNLRFFAGAAKEAESTVLPLLTSYVDEAFADIPECRSTDDHGVVLWINLPCCGVVPLHKYEWCVTAVSNILALYRRNGIAFVVHANRGQVAERAGKLKVFFVDRNKHSNEDSLEKVPIKLTDVNGITKFLMEIQYPVPSAWLLCLQEGENFQR